MIVRAAVAADVPAIAEIVERAYRGYIARIGRRPGPMDDDYAAQVDSAETEVFVAAPAESGPARGVIVLTFAPDHVLIENVAVDPDFQGTGVGRALLAFAEGRAAAGGLTEARLYTNVKMTENQRLYRGLGYAETGRRIGSEFARVYFTKHLDSPSRHRGVA